VSAVAKTRSQFTVELLKGLWKENPIFVMVLGMCPTLAVTNTLLNGFMMGLCTFFVLVPSSLFISLLRNVIPSQVRISTFIVIIATFVTMVDFAVQAISLDLHKALGAFISLIVVNCIILGRGEAFAYRNSVRLSVADAIGMALGFWLALLIMSGAREILGYGTLLDGTPWRFHVFGQSYEPWAVMILPPGGFLMLGAVLLVFAAVKQRRQRLEAALAAEQAGREGRAD
jgi:electron transport complex protein RnfE